MLAYRNFLKQGDVLLPLFHFGLGDKIEKNEMGGACSTHGERCGV
jgi:hypothetical protein